MNSAPHSDPNFDRIARVYRWAEYLALGPLLQRTRTHFLPQLKHVRHAVAFGEGDGRFLARLFAQNPRLQAVAVDSSRQMLHLLRERCDRARTQDDSQLSTRHANALSLMCCPDTRSAETISPDTQLVVSHFFLDCFTSLEVQHFAQHLAASLRPDTLWLVSDFAVPERGPMRPLVSLYIRVLYFAFRILTGLRITHLPVITPALQAAGFRPIARRQWLFGSLYSELWTLE